MPNIWDGFTVPNNTMFVTFEFPGEKSSQIRLKLTR